jgi:hypothetical protein
MRKLRKLELLVFDEQSTFDARSTSVTTSALFCKKIKLGWLLLSPNKAEVSKVDYLLKATS